MAKKLAMHVVAANPMFLAPEAVPAEVQTREKDVARQTVRRAWGGDRAGEWEGGSGCQWVCFWWPASTQICRLACPTDLLPFPSPPFTSPTQALDSGKKPNDLLPPHFPSPPPPRRWTLGRSRRWWRRWWRAACASTSRRSASSCRPTWWRRGTPRWVGEGRGRDGLID